VPHRSAPLSELGRLRLVRCVVDDGWPLRRAAERFQVSAPTAARWAGRYRQYGPAGMGDRSSRPHRCPQQTPSRVERRIIKVRVTTARLSPPGSTPTTTTAAAPHSADTRQQAASPTCQVRTPSPLRRAARVRARFGGPAGPAGGGAGSRERTSRAAPRSRYRGGCPPAATPADPAARSPPEA
jgi:transposase-like protein